MDFAEKKAWFESHISLGGKPYTLDADQARAVFDDHKNTLVVARAGSGKTRVIVAKVAYLIATHQAYLNELKVFMFNRTAAAEVNQRIGAVEIDGVPLKDFCKTPEIKVASTFHKFALDIVKASGEKPQLISESEHDDLIKSTTRKIVLEQKKKLSTQEYAEILRLASSFIARAGQKYLGNQGLADLCADVKSYISEHQDDPAYRHNIYLHQVCLAAYQEYLLALNFPKIDFNILMARAIRILEQNSPSKPAQHASQENPPRHTSQQNAVTASNQLLGKVQKYKYIMVDEYQDFSYLFYRIIQAVRQNCSSAHLFAVGDDWQAINRFAGSDVKYFLDFAKFFPEDVVNIPLSTNYRSDKKIVENANKYMLKFYNPKANKAIPFSSKSGKIKRLNPQKTKFSQDDLYEDALGDARYQKALAEICNRHSDAQRSSAQFLEAARLLKTIVKIAKHHRKEQILLLHRHNFTSFLGVSLEDFYQALKIILIEQNIMTATNFDTQVCAMTMHKSKGLESDVVILLELNRDQVLNSHPHATIFELFGDTRAAEKADQHRLLYVALTRAKHRLYLLSSDKKPVA